MWPPADGCRTTRAQAGLTSAQAGLSSIGDPGQACEWGSAKPSRLYKIVFSIKLFRKCTDQVRKGCCCFAAARSASVGWQNQVGNRALCANPRTPLPPWSPSTIVAWSVLGLKSARCKKVFGLQNPPLPQALLKLERSHVSLVRVVASRKSRSVKLHGLNARRGAVKQCTYTNRRLTMSPPATTEAGQQSIATGTAEVWRRCF